MPDSPSFDLVITDIEMPNMDGLTLTRMLRGDPRSAEWPILVLSSCTGAQVVDRARQAGVTDYVVKFDRQQLIEALKRAEQGIDLGLAA